MFVGRYEMIINQTPKSHLRQSAKSAVHLFTKAKAKQ
jgi:hypothetical protein